jgi:uncharacterized membrane protein YbhN (UPF0104 family)
VPQQESSHLEHDTASHEALAALSDGAHALDDTEPVVEAPKKKWRSRIITGIRIVLALGIVFYLINSTIRQWDEVRETFHVLTWGSLVGALILAVLSIGCNMMSWRAALADVHRRIPVRTAAPIALVGQLGKYSVWAYVVQMDLGRRAGVPRTRAFIASLVSTGLGVAVGLVLGSTGLRTALDAAKNDEHPTLGKLAFYVAVILLPIAVVCALPMVLTKVLQLMLKVLRRPPLDRPLSWKGVFEPMGWTLIAYALAGTHLWLLAQHLVPGVSGWTRCIGVIALSMSLALFVIIAPSGIGVREFLITIALGGGAGAFGIALASRLLFTLGDVIAAGIAAAVGLHRLKQAPEAVPATEPA